MSRIVRHCAFLLFFLLPAGTTWLQTGGQVDAPSAPEPSLTVAVYRLENSGIDESTAVVVSDLLFSFMREQRNYRIDFMEKTKGQALSSGTIEEETENHDFIFSGKISAEPEGIRLELLLEGGKPAAERFVSRVYENQNKLMLGTRLLVRELFDAQATALRPPDKPRETEASPPDKSGGGQTTGGAETSARETEGESSAFERIAFSSVSSLDALAGSWNGESGIEKIMILRGGRGAAIFSSGFSLMLNLSIKDGELVVSQKGKSSPLQFLDVPDVIAVQAAEQAPPLEWKFRISEDGKILAGEKKSVHIVHDGKTIISMDSKSEKVAWTRN